jgi:hypothetical protein
VNTAIIRKRDSLVADVEGLLMVWVDDQTSRHVPLNQLIIQNKAQNIVSDMNAKKGEAAKDAEFGASRGWFDRFKNRSNLHNIKVQGEAASADTVAIRKMKWGCCGRRYHQEPSLQKRSKPCQASSQLKIG